MARKGEHPAVSERTVAERKAQLAVDLLGDVERLRLQMFAPTTERRAMVVSDGEGLGSHVELVDIEREQPTFAEQKTLVTTIAVAVDKLVELDAGSEEEPADGIDELAERRAADRGAASGVDSSSAGGQQRR